MPGMDVALTLLSVVLVSVGVGCNVTQLRSDAPEPEPDGADEHVVHKPEADAGSHDTNRPSDGCRGCASGGLRPTADAPAPEAPTRRIVDAREVAIDAPPFDLLAEPSTLEGDTDFGNGARGEADDQSFRIILDYRLDKQLALKTKERRALRAAAAAWARHIASRFAPVPAGTKLQMPDPQDVDNRSLELSVDYAIRDVVVFPATCMLDGEGHTLAGSGGGFANVADVTLRTALHKRYTGAPHQPWCASVCFDRAEAFYVDPAPDPAGEVDPTQIDFYSVALHELGHVLGIGASRAFADLVRDAAFVGARAVAVYGGPVPLASDGVHVASSVRFGGEEVLMDPNDGPGHRGHITALDLAILEDLGYRLRPLSPEP